MKIIAGTFLGYAESNVNYNDKTTGEAKSFTRRQVSVLDGLDSERVELGRDLDPVMLPDPNTDIVLEVVPKVSSGRLYWTALRVLPVDLFSPVGK